MIFKKALKRCIEKLDIDDVAICLNETFFEGDVDREKTGYDDNISMFSGNGRTDIKGCAPVSYRLGKRAQDTYFLISS